MPLASTNYGRATTLNDGPGDYTESPGGGAPGAPAAPSAPTDAAKTSAYARLRTAYRNVFGPQRTVTDQELESHLAGRYDGETVRKAIATIVHSDEAGGYRESDVNKAYTATKPNAYARLKAAYQRYLGRPGTEADYESHLSGRYDLAAVESAISVIANSPEAANRPEGAGTTGGGEGATREDRDKLQWGSTGRMLGFQVGSDYGGDVKARNSVKNTFGRLASRYPNTPEGLKQLVNDPDFQKYFPNASLVPGGAGDKIDFGNVMSDFETGSPVGVVDVLVNADPTKNSADGWAWQPAGASSGTPAPPPTPPTPPTPPGPNDQTGGGTTTPPLPPAFGLQSFFDYLRSQQRLPDDVSNYL